MRSALYNSQILSCFDFNKKKMICLSQMVPKSLICYLEKKYYDSFNSSFPLLPCLLSFLAYLCFQGVGKEKAKKISFSHSLLPLYHVNIFQVKMKKPLKITVQGLVTIQTLKNVKSKIVSSSFCFVSW